MSKNIVICCDGTGNQFGNSNSNVVKLFSVIERDPREQIAYYDPGVGTTKSTGVLISLKSWWRKLLGLATGYGIYENVYEAYSYLMENYEEGDKIFLFGFSRGAYTVRVLSGFVFMMGLLEKGCQNLIPYAFQIYARKKPDFKIAGKFKSNFSRNCPIEFMGIWDTVSSVGYFGNWKSYPYTTNNKNVKIIRHALAIDERRAFYNQNSLGSKENEGQSIKEVWFTGVHSDIGGSYDELESGLSKITLQWMLNEAKLAHLKIDAARYSKYVLQNSKGYVGPDPHGKIHNSLNGIWYLLEIIPRLKVNYSTGYRKWFIPWGRRREIQNNAFVHETVFQRMSTSDYKPGNLPEETQKEKIKEEIKTTTDNG